MQADMLPDSPGRGGHRVFLLDPEPTVRRDRLETTDLSLAQGGSPEPETTDLA